jgi:hypothetical protein
MATLFTDVLRQARKGKAVEVLTEDLADLVKTCTELGKSGELTLKLKIVPDKASSGVVDIEFDVSVKKPKPNLPKSPFYVGEHGSLLRSDPNQGEMWEDADERLNRGNA